MKISVAIFTYGLDTGWASPWFIRVFLMKLEDIIFERGTLPVEKFFA